MTTRAFKFKCIAALVFALGCQAPVFSQSASTMADRLHANAVDSFRQGRFPEAFGRFIGLADAGHAPSAALALWMYQQGPTLFGRDWDSTQDQLSAWAQLARQPAPIMVGHVYRQAPIPVALRPR